MTTDFTGSSADALARDLADERDAPHPRPHVGCMACDPANVRTQRAFAGIKTKAPTKTPGTPNRVRVVLVDGAAIIVSVPERRGA